MSTIRTMKVVTIVPYHHKLDANSDALKGELNLESKRRTSRPASNQNARPESKERYSRPTSSGGVGAGSGSRPYSSQEERASRQATNRMLADPEDEGTG